MNQSQGVDEPTACVSHSGKSIAWIDTSKEAILIRDIATGRQVRLNWPDHEPTGLTLSPDDKLLAAADLKNRGGLAIWNIASGRQLAALDDIRIAGKWPGRFGLPFRPTQNCWPLRRTQAFCSGTGKLENRERFWKVPARKPTVLAFSADGGLLAAAAVDAARSGVATVRIWDLQADELLTECHIAGQEVAALAFSPDGRRLAERRYHLVAARDSESLGHNRRP